MTETINVLGLELPVIAKLPHGFTLALHKNGPCICTETTIFTLTYWMIEGFEGDELPRDVAQAAIDAYVAYSWPLIQQIERTAAELEAEKSKLCPHDMAKEFADSVYKDAAK